VQTLRANTLSKTHKLRTERTVLALRDVLLYPEIIS